MAELDYEVEQHVSQIAAIVKEIGTDGLLEAMLRFAEEAEEDEQDGFFRDWANKLKRLDNRNSGDSLIDFLDNTGAFTLYRGCDPETGKLYDPVFVRQGIVADTVRADTVRAALVAAKDTRQKNRR